ncbi:tripartite motif-containing protein 3-like isoform X1 [Ptychodera flava]|uniref:tripartite motif-containing protein 3-like isoform X1 n=1 Tax=Ptychodera flava TaxID=63121 RepID=UPI003969EDF9
MASSSDFGEKLLTDIDDKVLLCAICMERFKSPKILPCHHTFCEHCLTKWVKANNSQLICPTCKNQWPLPSGGVPAITSNRFLNDLLEVIGDVNPGRVNEAVCDGCKKEAKYWCGDCGGQFYCDACMKAHRAMRICQDHEPITMEEYNEKMSTQHFRMTKARFCPTHRTTKLEFYCDTCQVPICHKCIVVDHPPGSDHKMLSLESAMEKYMPEMKAHSQKIAQKVSDLKLRKDRAHDLRKDLDANKSTADQQINTLCQKLIDEIKQQQIKMQCQVDDIYISKCKQSDATIELLEHKIASAESMLSYLNHLLTFGGAVDIMSVQKQMKDQQQHYDDLTNVPCTDIDSDLVFRENSECLRIDLGVVKGKNLTKPGKPIQSEVKRKDGDRMETMTHTQLQVERKEENMIKQTSNTGLEVIEGNELGDVEKKQTKPEPLVVKAKQDQLRKAVQLTKGDTTKSTKTKQSNLRPCAMKRSSGGWSKFILEGQGPSPGQKFKDPCGLTFHNDRLLVCDKNNNIVQILNQDYTCEKVLGSFSGQFAKPFKPQSVAVSKDNHYFILDDNNKQIIVCDQNNKVIRIITLPADVNPYCIALLKGFVLVTDVKGHRLLKYTVTGQYIAEVDGQVGGKKRFDSPRFVAVNSRDVIMVSDCHNHCIKCFDSDFNYLYQYGEYGHGDSQLYFPASIAVDGADNVYVCDGNDRISIWSRDGTWLFNLFTYSEQTLVHCSQPRQNLC